MTHKATYWKMKGDRWGLFTTAKVVPSGELVAYRIPRSELKGLTNKELAEYFGQKYDNVKHTAWFKNLKKEVN
jgi:hypothetical protein